MVNQQKQVQQETAYSAVVVNDHKIMYPVPAGQVYLYNQFFMYSTHSSVPSVLEYMSYCFNFHSVLAGPAVTMREHLSFMDSSNFTVTRNTTTHLDGVGTYHLQVPRYNIIMFAKLSVPVCFIQSSQHFLPLTACALLTSLPICDIPQSVCYLSSLEWY